MFEWTLNDAASAGAAVLTLYLLYWMLIARSAAKGTQRLSAPARLPSPSTSVFPRRAIPTRTITTASNMLRGAVQKHEQAAARRENFFSSSPAQPASHTITSSNANPGYRTPLKPATASSLNALHSDQLRPALAGSGVKRMASGLAKALDGSFDDGLGSQQRPITIDEQRREATTITKVTQDDFYDENEFGSDIELDVEEPRTITYPKLPQPLATSPSQKPLLHPTQPRQQQAQTGFLTEIDLPPSVDYKSVPPPLLTSSPGSSNPLPWSSSPSEHYRSVMQAVAAQPGIQPKVSLLKQFGFAQPDAVPPEVDGLHPRPSKKRTLPWLKDDAETQDEGRPLEFTASTKPKAHANADATPLARNSKKASFPWNTSASAVKEQQKQHREQTKKAIKKNEADDESRAKAKSSRARPARVFLSEEQQGVLDLVVEKKKSVFFTGSAGTGKSVLMREIIDSLRKRFQREPDRVAVTASTGLAACNVGGVTLHSFAGIGLGKEAVPELVRKIRRNQKAKHRWMRTKILVVDEVSMVDGDLFDKLEAIARQLRNNGRPFGGIQLVITGDFFQLPPVPDSGRVAKFAFDAATWSTTVEHTIALHQVFRQKDPIFAGMLNEMREGRLSESSIQAFRKLSRPLTFEDSLDATELFPTRSEVDRANTERLMMLQGTAQVFDAKDGGMIVDKAQRDKLLQNCMAPDVITIKKGAQVMLIKNVDDTLVNGSIGRVIGFMSETTFGDYTHNEDAYAKSASGTVASTPPLTAAHGDNRLMQAGGITTTRKWPVVRFMVADGTSRDLLCQPETWKVELPNGEVQASRAQIPLILAWALSIHKAQGQTLARVKVDLGKVFEKGQAYVALSRATSMNGLQVLRFDPKKVNAHERVRTFYSNLSRVELAEKNKDRMEKVSKKPGVLAENYEKRFVEDGWDGDA